MKRVSVPVESDLDALVEAFEAFSMVEWKAGPEEVLEAVDAVLKRFGLEVVMPNSDYDLSEVFFKIQRRPRRRGKKAT